MIMITIDDVTYKEEDLTPEAITNVQRISELRQELVAHNTRAAELNVLISAYANAIKSSLAVEDVAAQD